MKVVDSVVYPDLQTAQAELIRDMERKDQPIGDERRSDGHRRYNLPYSQDPDAKINQAISDFLESNPEPDPDAPMQYRFIDAPVLGKLHDVHIQYYQMDEPVSEDGYLADIDVSEFGYLDP